MFSKSKNIPFERILDEFLSSKGIELSILRLDQTHEHISGNKWYKLKYNLAKARESNFNRIITFGGAFSNHIAATATAGKEYGFETTGIIRGEKVRNSTLDFAEAQGMRFKFITRSEYRDKYNQQSIDNLTAEFGDHYLIPEGGTNDLAIKGTREIVDLFDHSNYDYICSSIGTGGTIAGLITSSTKAYVLGFSSLKGDFVNDMVGALIPPKNANNYDIFKEYHFGGFAKVTGDLIDFINTFKTKHNIQLEPIYTGKMLFGLYDLIEKDYFKPGSKIIAIHTGGLQGLAGMKEKYPELN